MKDVLQNIKYEAENLTDEDAIVCAFEILRQRIEKASSKERKNELKHLVEWCFCKLFHDFSQ